MDMYMIELKAVVFSETNSMCALSWSGQLRRASTCLMKVADQALVWLGRRRLPSELSSCCPPTRRRTTASRISFSRTSLFLKATWTNSRVPSNRWIEIFDCDSVPTACCIFVDLTLLISLFVWIVFSSSKRYFIDFSKFFSSVCILAHPPDWHGGH